MLDRIFGKPGKLETRKRSKESDIPETGLSEEMEGQLAIDVYQTPDELIVESTIAGVKLDDIDIDVSSEKVTVRGERHRDSKTAPGHDYFWQECFWGKFSRSIILPEEIDPDKAHFTLKRGVLSIFLPKVHKDRVRKITGKEIKDD